MLKWIALSLGFSLAASYAQAEEWRAASPAPEGNHDLAYIGDVPPEGGAPWRSDFVDSNWVVRNGDFATVWTFRVYWPATARTAADAAAVWHRFQIDCFNHTAMQTAIVILGDELDVLAQNERPEPIRNIVPGSSTALIADIGCGIAELPVGAPRFSTVEEAFAAPRGALGDASR